MGIPVLHIQQFRESKGLDEVYINSFSHHMALNKVNLPFLVRHSKLNTAQIYLKPLPTTMLDDYNEKLIEAI